MSSEDRLCAITVHLFKPGLSHPHPPTPVTEVLVMELARWLSSYSFCLLTPVSLSPSPLVSVFSHDQESLYPPSSINTLEHSVFNFFLYLFVFISPSPLLSYLSFFCLFLLLPVWPRQLYAFQLLTKGLSFSEASTAFPPLSHLASSKGPSGVRHLQEISSGT